VSDVDLTQVNVNDAPVLLLERLRQASTLFRQGILSKVF
jgi:hypothetical protein